MELNVGDYVRTKDYGIRKITSFISDIENDYICCDDENNRILINKKEIIDSRPKIINLIEVGDYVNGYKVMFVMYKEEKDIPTIIKCFNDYYIKENEIENIVTKDQFEAMKYKVGDN